jgi:gliding-associated putative ABC transporter substrate-binding component GldG
MRIGMKKIVTSSSFLAFAIGAIILVCIVSNFFFFRIDFTSDNRYSLSKATKDILKSIDSPVTVTAYFTKDLPPAILQTKSEFKDMLVEYANRSHGKIVYEFIDPGKDEDAEREINQKGIAPRVVNVREKDEAVQKKVYLGAILKYQGKEEVIPFILTGSAMEYSLSTTIKKLVTKNRPSIGFVQGQGEPTVSYMPQAINEINVLHNVESVYLTDSTNLDKYKTLAIVNPSDTIMPDQLRMLDRYLSHGGNLYIAMNRVEGNFSTVTGNAVSTGLETWLAQKGITVAPQFVTDKSCGTVGVQQQQGVISYTTQIPFHYLPLVTKFADHPISKGLEKVAFQFASPISYTGSSSVKYTPLALSSDRSGTLDVPLTFDIQKKWFDSDFPKSSIPVAAAFEGPLVSGSNSKLVLITDGEFAINGEGRQARQINPDNINLMVNSLDWLSDDTGLNELRTKGVASRPLKEIEDGKKNFLKYLNFLLPVLLIIFYGVARNSRNNSKKIKRMQDFYI